MKHLVILLCLVLALTGGKGGERMTGTGTAVDPYIITTRADLEAINNDLTAYYELGANIDLAGTDWRPLGWTTPYDPYAITAFSGQLDGKNHKLTGMTMTIDADAVSVDNELYDIGLFGNVSGTVKNLALCSMAIALDTGVSANYIERIGGIAGQCSGTLSGITVSGIITFTGNANACGRFGGLAGEVSGSASTCYCSLTITDSSVGTGYGGTCIGWLSGTATLLDARGSMTGAFAAGTIGGCIGQLSSGSITSCRCSVRIVDVSGSACGGFVGANNAGTIETSSSTGDVAKVLGGTPANLGGFVGSSNAAGTFTDCYAIGDVDGDAVVGGFVGNDNGAGTGVGYTNCYSTGAVAGVSGLGGFAGTVSSRTATSCYWDTQTSGQATSALGTGKTTAQMQTQSTFTGWDFSTVWNIASGTYPFLRTAFVTITDACASLAYSFPWVGKFQLSHVTA